MKRCGVGAARSTRRAERPGKAPRVESVLCAKSLSCSWRAERQEREDSAPRTRLEAPTRGTFISAKGGTDGALAVAAGCRGNRVVSVSNRRVEMLLACIPAKRQFEIAAERAGQGQRPAAGRRAHSNRRPSPDEGAAVRRAWPDWCEPSPKGFNAELGSELAVPWPAPPRSPLVARELVCSAYCKSVHR